MFTNDFIYPGMGTSWKEPDGYLIRGEGEGKFLKYQEILDEAIRMSMRFGDVVQRFQGIFENYFIEYRYQKWGINPHDGRDNTRWGLAANINDGGTTPSYVNRDPRQVNISFDPGSDMVYSTVSDVMPGLSKENLEKAYLVMKNGTAVWEAAHPKEDTKLQDVIKYYYKRYE